MPAPTRPPRRAVFVAFATCASLVLTSFAPTLALAAPEAAAESTDPETIFRRGQAKYETADYNGAIELWTEAYSLIDSTPETATIKALLIYNLAQAHVKAFELDEELIHLKQAQQLLESFRANLALLYEDPAQLEEETAKVDERLAEVEQMLAEAEAKAEANQPPGEADPPAPAVEPGAEEPVDAGPVGPSGKPLIIAGGVVLGLGVGAGAVAIVGGVIGGQANDISGLAPDALTEREAQFDRGRTGNILLIVGAVGAGVLVAGGAALIAIGAKRNKDRAGRSAALRPTLAPSFGASFGGPSGAGGSFTVSGTF